MPERSMRFTMGVITGILLTFGVAYVTDMLGSAPGPDGREAARMVNWNVVADNMRGLSSEVQDGWARLTGAARKLYKGGA